jgi:hypothetical protein
VLLYERPRRRLDRCFAERIQIHFSSRSPDLLLPLGEPILTLVGRAAEGRRGSREHA